MRPWPTKRILIGLLPTLSYHEDTENTENTEDTKDNSYKYVFENVVFFVPS